MFAGSPAFRGVTLLVSFEIPTWLFAACGLSCFPGTAPPLPDVLLPGPPPLVQRPRSRGWSGLNSRSPLPASRNPHMAQLQPSAKVDPAATMAVVGSCGRMFRLTGSSPGRATRTPAAPGSRRPTSGSCPCPWPCRTGWPRTRAGSRSCPSPSRPPRRSSPPRRRSGRSCPACSSEGHPLLEALLVELPDRRQVRLLVHAEVDDLDHAVAGVPPGADPQLAVAPALELLELGDHERVLRLDHVPVGDPRQRFVPVARVHHPSTSTPAEHVVPLNDLTTS